MPKLEKTMFRKYDLRGRVDDKELNKESMSYIAKGFASMLEQDKIKDVIVGYDGGLGAKKLTKFFIKGLVDSGRNVIDIGMVLTPILYFSQYKLNKKGAAMITASHNPGEWTGVKFSNDFSKTFLPKQMEELYKTIEKDKFVSGKGTVKHYKKIIQDYTKDVLKRLKLKRKLKLVIDSGNGTAGPIVPPILKKFGCEVIELYCDLDPTFPHHNPNPSEIDGLKDLQKLVVKENADLGLAIDGDGDRLGVIDEKGNIIYPDRFLILLARQMLKKKPGAKIIFDVKCSQALEEDIRAHGGKPIMWLTGHSYIKQKMWEEKAPMAGEMSGHIFYMEYYGFDDATYAALKLLEYLSSQEKTVSQLIADTPYYVSTPAFHADCPDEVKYEIVKKLVKEFKKDYKVIDIDGARVVFDDGWGLVRASSNLPALVIRVEAKDKKSLEKIQAIFKKKLAKYPEIGKNWYPA